MFDAIHLTCRRRGGRVLNPGFGGCIAGLPCDAGGAAEECGGEDPCAHRADDLPTWAGFFANNALISKEY